MRKTILLLLAVLISGLGFAQEGFNYKALVTDNGNPVANGTIDVKVTIKNSTNTLPIEWQEEHTGVPTDANGIFSIVIGEGNRLAGATSFDEIVWGPDFKISVEVDTSSGYTPLVVDEPLQYVPYAKLSEKLTTRKDVSIDSDAAIIFSDFDNNNVPNFYISNNLNNNTTLDLGHLETIGPYTLYKPNLSIYYNGNVKIHGKLIAPDTGDNDLKPIAYGNIHLSGGVASIRGGTENFTIHKMNTGYIKITLNNYTDLNSSNTFVIATSTDWAATPARINAWALDNDNNFIYVKTFDKNNNYIDRDFSFVIYKK